MKRRELLAVACSGAACAFAAGAQQRSKVARIGFLDPGYASAFTPYVDAFREGLRDLGYFEDGNIVIEVRWAENDYNRLPTLAKELVASMSTLSSPTDCREYLRPSRRR